MQIGYDDSKKADEFMDELTGIKNDFMHHLEEMVQAGVIKQSTADRALNDLRTYVLREVEIDAMKIDVGAESEKLRELCHKSYDDLIAGRSTVADLSREALGAIWCGFQAEEWDPDSVPDWLYDQVETALDAIPA